MTNEPYCGDPDCTEGPAREKLEQLLHIAKTTLDEFEKAEHSWEGREGWWYDHGLPTRNTLAEFIGE